MAAAQHDLTVERGASLRRTLTLRNKDTGTLLDLTGSTARLRVYPPNSRTVAVEATVGNGGVVVIGSAGQIVFTLTDVQVDGLAAPVNRYRLDLIGADAVVTPLLKGALTVED